MAESGRLRIGELSRRSGVSPELLRAWESRYGVVRPERSPGGSRLYSEHDVRRVQTMRSHIDSGLSAAEAARLATQGDGVVLAGEPADPTVLQTTLERSVETLDEPRAHATLDRAFASMTLESALSEVILPFLRRLGERWAVAQMSVAQEHFASNLIGGRLRSLARDWGDGVGPRALLACPPGERHELGLLCFGLALAARGWRITYIGADTPLDEVVGALDELSPAIVVLCAIDAQRYLDASEEITALRRRVRIGIGGAGAGAPLADFLGVELLGEDIVGAAARLRA